MLTQDMYVLWFPCCLNLISQLYHLDDDFMSDLEFSRMILKPFLFEDLNSLKYGKNKMKRTNSMGAFSTCKLLVVGME